MQTDTKDKQKLARIELRKKLRHGDIAKIARITGNHRTKIQRYFLNQTNDERIEKCVKALIKKHDLEFEQSLKEALQ